MKNMKKIAALGMSAVMVAGMMAGCGSSSDSSSSDSKGSSKSRAFQVLCKQKKLI